MIGLAVFLALDDAHVPLAQPNGGLLATHPIRWPHWDIVASRHPQHPALEGTLQPLRIYSICYRALLANGDPRAGEILDATYHLLQERAPHFPNVVTAALIDMLRRLTANPFRQRCPRQVSDDSVVEFFHDTMTSLVRRMLRKLPRTQENI